ncbi:hypothetical protein IMSHALPRED_002808 [Imshaugia aleurites]|uniref:Glycosyl hydrolase n=1 Tax=Imshaugia aleurites TaxID=172621 RepID=A0A8H3J6F1_9LECA|nr:hypothetical protein IMSHALPRED_002808 [Imshaugia aleurites]
MQIDWPFLLFTFAVSVLGSHSRVDRQVLNNHEPNVSHARAAIIELQYWYNETTGLWETTGWWNSANVLTMVADFVAVDSSLDVIAEHVFQNTFSQAQKASLATVKVMTPYSVTTYTGPQFPPWINPPKNGFSGFLNDFYDDEAWWALAWLKIHDLTKQQQYLQTAIDIFEDMAKGWGGTCEGLWWNKQHSYKGAIENALFLTVAAQLANRASNQEYYLNWARKEWDWFQQTGMINSHYNINNGISLVTCQTDNGTVWSYNQGVILGGLLELYRAAPDKTYLTMAERIALAGINFLCDSHGILHDPCEPNCGADGPQFKGIFIRNLQKLQLAVPNDQFKKFINNNSDSIWLNDRGPGSQLGLIWSGPFMGATASTQSSAADALVAALAIQGQKLKLNVQ